MSRAKRALVQAALLIFAVWPVVHIGLVKRYDINPWKLAGWGMYSAPQLPCRLRVFCLTPDEVGLYELRTLDPVLEQKARQFLRRRRALRRLARPDALGAAVLEDAPAIDGVRIEVMQPFLDPASGMIEQRVSSYEYLR